MSTIKLSISDEKIIRIHQALDEYGVKKWGRNAEVADKTGYSSNQVSVLLGEKAPLNDRFIKSLCLNFNISEEWIRTGKGEMFTKAPTVKEEFMEYEGKKRPMYNIAVRILAGKNEEELEQIVHQLLDEAKGKKKD